MTVALTSLGLETSNEVQYLSLSGYNAVPVLLDSGTTLLQVPSDVFEELYSWAGVSQDSASDIDIVDCELAANANGTLNFGFGGNNRPIIKVPFSEFALPVYGAEVNMPNGNKGCKFGVQEGDEWILGDTFLRSAYVVYDLDEEKIWLAQTKYNSTSSNVVEIGDGKGSSTIISIAGTSVAQTVTVHQTATGLVGGVETGTPSFSLPASATGTLTGGLGQAMGATGTASGTATGSTSSPSASGSSAASST